VHQACLENWLKNENKIGYEIYNSISKVYTIKCEICNSDIKYLKEYRNTIIKSVLKMIQSIVTSTKNLSILSIHSLIIFFFTKRISSFLYESLVLLKKSFHPEAVMKLIQNISIFFSIIVGLKDIYFYYTKMYYEKRKSIIKFLEVNSLN